MIITERLNEASAVKTWTGALNRLLKCEALIGDNPSMVAAREDGMFVPVVFVRPGKSFNAFALASAGIFVTN